MAKALGDLRERLSKAPRWAIFAILIAVGIATYYGVIGTQWWTESRKLTDLEHQISELDAGIASMASEEELAAELEERKEILELWQSLYTYDGYEKWETLYQEVDSQGPNLLVIIVTDLAKKSNVNLISYLLSEPRPVPTEEGIDFQAQPLTLSLEGDSHQKIFDFISTLHDSVPIFSVQNIGLGGFDGVPSARVGLLFFILIPDSEAEGEVGQT